MEDKVAAITVIYLNDSGGEEEEEDDEEEDKTAYISTYLPKMRTYRW
jgi:hypothetical protein